MTKTHEQWLGVQVLLDAMKEAGAAWYTRNPLYAAEKSGKLTLPRMPNGNRERVVTESQILEIIKAFSPGGSGEWHYTKENDA